MRMGKMKQGNIITCLDGFLEDDTQDVRIELL